MHEHRTASPDLLLAPRRRSAYSLATDGTVTSDSERGTSRRRFPTRQRYSDEGDDRLRTYPPGMTPIDAISVLRFAELSVEALAMNDAALARDMDEARVRAHLIFGRALVLGLPEVADAAREVERLLGVSGTEPSPGYGHAMLRLANLLTPR